MAVKIHSVGPDHQYGWHAFQYLTVVPRIPVALLLIRCRVRRWAPKRGKAPLSSMLGDQAGAICWDAGAGTSYRGQSPTCQLVRVALGTFR